MPGLVRICSQAQLPDEGEVREVVASGRPFCVARVDGEIAVLDGLCPHHQGPLGSAEELSAFSLPQSCKGSVAILSA